MTHMPLVNALFGSYFAEFTASCLVAAEIMKQDCMSFAPSR